MRVIGFLILVAGAGSLAACSDRITRPDENSGAAIPNQLPGLIISDAMSNVATSGGSGGGSAVVFISLPPGTLSGVTSLRIRNATIGGSAEAAIPVVEGGFDPVPVAARAGDELELELIHEDGSVTLARVAVPARRPPVVVRTAPPAGRTDVALSVQPVIVFSEPLDRGSISPATIGMRTGANVIEVEIAVPEERPWVVELAPAEPLQPGMLYTLEITTGVRDRQGEALEAPLSVSFATEPGPPVVLVPQIVFVSDRTGIPSIYVANADGSAATLLAVGDYPAWSPDGRKIAYSRGEVIYTMNSDGTEQKPLVPGGFPDWSPDGTRIAFNSPDYSDPGIFVVNTDGTDARKLIDYEFGAPEDGDYEGYGEGWVGRPAWSPDGRSIAFVRTNWDSGGRIYTMNADGSEPRKIDPEDLPPEDEPAWTIDGSRILATTWEFDDGRYIRVLASFDAIHTGDLEVHYRPAPHAEGYPAYLGNPRSSPDGRQLIFDRFASLELENGEPYETRLRIFVLDLETGTARQLIPEALAPTRTEYGDWHAAWAQVTP